MYRFVPAVRRLRRFRLRAVAAACLIAGSASAEGAATPPTTDGCTDSNTARDPDAARVAFRAGQTAFSEGGYARAVELWNQAYEDDCTAHALLLNLAMAQELLGRPHDAIHTLTLFNRRSPRSPYVDANLKRIQHLQLAVAEKGDERSRRERALGGPATGPSSADVGTALSLPLVVGITGTAIAVLGTVLFVEGRASAADADERCGASRQACTAVDGVVDGERARARSEVGGWMAGAGLVTAAGGLVWHFLAQPSRPLDQSTANSGVSFRADAPSRMAGLEWRGHF